MTPLRWMLVWILGIALIGCAVFEAKETSFLRSAQDRATQDEVKQQLGQPAMTRSRTFGESEWVYQVKEQQPGSRMNAPGTWCDEYVLAFDSHGILRRWTHRSYFHGGENNPTYCVPGGADGKP